MGWKKLGGSDIYCGFVQVVGLWDVLEDVPVRGIGWARKRERKSCRLDDGGAVGPRGGLGWSLRWR